jgi:fatty acid desaturase
MHALSVLNKEFVARGWHRKPTGRILAELAFHLALVVGGIALVVRFENWWVKALGMLVLTWGSLGVSTSTHTSSHYATSDRRWVNRALTYFGYPFFFAMAATYWWNKHVAVHHPTPNVIGFDDDVDLMPFFAINEKEFEESKGLQRAWFKVQWLFIPFLIALNYVNVQFTSWRYLYKCLRDPSRRTGAHWWDVVAIAGFFMAWLVIPGLLFGWKNAIIFYTVRAALVGYALFVAFAPAHFPAEAVFLDREIENRAEYFRKADYILLQTSTTLNFRTGFFGRLACAGVDYQIEHHLFPGIPHVYYPEMSVLLRQFCEENGYPYQTLGWWEGIWKSLAAFKTPRPVVAKLDDLRVSNVTSLPLPEDRGMELPKRELVA